MFELIPWVQLLAAALTTILVLKYYFTKRRIAPTIHKLHWRENVVYLYQFHRAKQVPNISPFCFKLECWLRMNNIEYEVISTMMKRSKEGTLPFIELNGQQYHDSTFIVQQLAKLFNKEEKLNAEERGLSRAIQQMVECSLIQTTMYVKFIEFTTVFLGNGLTGYEFPMPLVYILSPLVRWAINNRLWNSGMGRHEGHEITQIGLADIQALSDILGGKEYFLGSEPHGLDAVVFGHLACTYYLNLNTPHKQFIENQCPNLVEFCARFKQRYWPDWNENLKK